MHFFVVLIVFFRSAKLQIYNFPRAIYTGILEDFMQAEWLQNIETKNKVIGRKWKKDRWAISFINQPLRSCF